MEYAIVRQLRTSVLEREEPALNGARDIVVSAIFEAVRKSGAEFTATEPERRNRYEKALPSQLQALREERELRENFVSVLTHDLRNPLTAARMTAQLLLRERYDPQSARCEWHQSR